MAFIYLSRRFAPRAPMGHGIERIMIWLWINNEYLFISVYSGNTDSSFIYFISGNAATTDRIALGQINNVHYKYIVFLANHLDLIYKLK